MTSNTHSRNPEGESPKFFDRRMFIRAGALAAAIGVVNVIRNYGPEPEISPHAAELDKAVSSGENLQNEITDGMDRLWTKASVWPGLLVLSAASKLCSSPVAANNGPIKWPGPKSAKLLVQRPFFIRRSLELNPFDDDSFKSEMIRNMYPAYKGIRNSGADMPEMMLGFWLPQSEKVAFVDFEKNSKHINALSRSSTEVLVHGNVISGEDITLGVGGIGDEFGYSDEDGLTWRFLHDNGTYKTCGRSKLEDDPQKVLRAIAMFTQPPYMDLLPLPSEIVENVDLAKKINSQVGHE